jgi:hypothetical protein
MKIARELDASTESTTAKEGAKRMRNRGHHRHLRRDIIGCITSPDDKSGLKEYTIKIMPEKHAKIVCRNVSVGRQGVSSKIQRACCERMHDHVHPCAKKQHCPGGREVPHITARCASGDISLQEYRWQATLRSAATSFKMGSIGAVAAGASAPHSSSTSNKPTMPVRIPNRIPLEATRASWLCASIW